MDEQIDRMQGSGITMLFSRNYGPFKENHRLDIELFRNVSTKRCHITEYRILHSRRCNDTKPDRWAEEWMARQIVNDK